MKKTLIHSLTFPPDTISTGMIVSEIADGINSEHHNIEVLASSPQYNLKSADSFIQNNKYLKSEFYKDIKVHYIKSSPRQFVNSLINLTHHFQTLNSILMSQMMQLLLRQSLRKHILI